MVTMVALAALGFGLVTMWLWNALIPAIFGVGEITFIQAIGLLILSRVLFGGGFRGHRGRGLPGLLELADQRVGPPIQHPQRLTGQHLVHVALVAHVAPGGGGADLAREVGEGPVAHK